MSQTTKYGSKQVFITLLVFSSGFFFSNLLRNVNSIITPDLVAIFSLNSQELGFMTAMYFISFALAQAPLGIAIDHYGGRNCQIFLLGFAILGCLVFAISQNYLSLLTARLMIGFGFSGSLMTGLVVLAKVVPSKGWPPIYGWYLAIGNLGTLFAGQPTHWMIATFDWRTLFLMFAFACLVCLALLLLINSNPPTPNEQNKERKTSFIAHLFDRKTWIQFKTILRDPMMQAVLPFIGIANGIYMACLGVWSASFMRNAQHLSEEKIALIITGMAIVICTCSPLVGWLIAQRHRLFPNLSTERAIFLLALPSPLFFLLAVLPSGSWLPYSHEWNWLLVAFFFTPSIQCYALVTSHTAPKYAGRVNTTLNFALFFCGFIFQYGIGLFLQILVDYGVLPLVTSYRVIFYIAALLILLSLLWMPYRLYTEKTR